jgi:hypothetical protein
MTLYYPDISSWNTGIDLAGARAVCVKITEGESYANPAYAAQRAEAARHGALLTAYHFLIAGRGAAQAAWCHARAGNTPLMVDAEATYSLAHLAAEHSVIRPRPRYELAAGDGGGPLHASSMPSVADMCGFIDAYRAAGGVTHLLYLPHWYWQQIGSPSLAPLAQRKMVLVSSAYTTYTDRDGGTGWQPYGTMTPAVWQYTSSLQFGGQAVDFNAYRGSHAGDQSPAGVAAVIAQYRELVTTGSAATPAGWYWHHSGGYFTYAGAHRDHPSGPVAVSGHQFYWHAHPATGAPRLTAVGGAPADPPSGPAVWG